MKTIILYFSGTGNCLALSKEIAKQLGETDLSPILKANQISISRYNRIGIVFPVYYLHSPGVVMDFLKKTEFKKQQKIFLIAAFGGSWGYALSEAQNVLSKKVSFIQAFRVRMPGNYLLEYGAFPVPLQKAILKNAKKKIKRIISDIKNEKSVLDLSPNLIARLFKSTGDNKNDEFHQLGTQFYVGEDCKYCGTCSSLCPVNNITIENSKIQWGRHCQQCMACIQWCPHHAVMHPHYKEKRKRYVNPEISLKDFL